MYVVLFCYKQTKGCPRPPLCNEVHLIVSYLCLLGGSHCRDITPALESSICGANDEHSFRCEGWMLGEHGAHFQRVQLNSFHWMQPKKLGALWPCRTTSLRRSQRCLHLLRKKLLSSWPRRVHHAK